MPRRTYQIDGLLAAMDVVECFVTAPDGTRGVTEISRMTGLAKDRVFRILSTFGSRGYVERDIGVRKYRLGPGLLVLGEAFRSRLDIRVAAQPFLVKLAQESGDAAHLLIRHGRQALVIDVLVGHHILQAVGRIGESLPFHIGAVPKILLAFIPPLERAEILESMEFHPRTPKTVTSRKVLEAELERICSKGYCVAEEDYELGAQAIGAPIMDHDGQVIAGLSLVVPESRYTPVHKSRVIELVVGAARGVSERIGYRPQSKDAGDLKNAAQ
jgi:DNA-binding IclR family transcriptional regulator